MNVLHIELDEKTNVNDLLQIDTIISMLTIEIVFSLCNFMKTSDYLIINMNQTNIISLSHLFGEIWLPWSCLIRSITFSFVIINVWQHHIDTDRKMDVDVHWMCTYLGRGMSFERKNAFIFIVLSNQAILGVWRVVERLASMDHETMTAMMMSGTRQT